MNFYSLREALASMPTWVKLINVIYDLILVASGIMLIRQEQVREQPLVVALSVVILMGLAVMGLVFVILLSTEDEAR